MDFEFHQRHHYRPLDNGIASYHVWDIYHKEPNSCLGPYVSLCKNKKKERNSIPKNLKEWEDALKAGVLLAVTGNTLRTTKWGDFTQLMKAQSLTKACLDIIACCSILGQKSSKAKIFNTSETLSSPQKICWTSYADLTRRNSEKYLSFWRLTNFSGMQANNSWVISP